MLGHTLKSSYLRTYTLSYDVPMFFFLSGYCFRCNGESYKTLMKKMRTIVVPYICFSLLSIIAFGVLSIIYPRVALSLDCNVFRNICVMLYGNSKPDVMKYNSPLWFLSCFFIVNILSLLLEPFIIKDKRGGVKRYLILMLSAVMNVIVTNLSADLALPWHLETAFSMLFWYELGIVIQSHSLLNYFKEIKVFNNSAKFILIVIISFTAGIISTFANFNITKTSLQVRQDIYGVIPLYYLAALGGIVFMCYLALCLQNVTWLQKLGKNTLSVLCLHKFPVLAFQEVLPYTRNLLAGGNSMLLCLFSGLILYQSPSHYGISVDGLMRTIHGQD